VLKREKPFVFLTGFDRGLAEPFIPFWPGSTTCPLLSAAIFYNMQLFVEVMPALSRVGSVFGVRRWFCSGELAEELWFKRQHRPGLNSMDLGVSQSER
jgi:hypothetical protein